MGVQVNMAEQCSKHEQQIKDLKERVDNIEKDSKVTREELIKNNATTQQVAEALPKLTNAIHEFQITMVNVDNNIKGLNDRYDYMKNDMQKVKDDVKVMNDKKTIDLDSIRKDVVTKWLVRLLLGGLSAWGIYGALNSIV